MDYKLEVVVLPVTEVERAKDFYAGLGWRPDAGFTGDGGFRVADSRNAHASPGAGA